MCNPTNEQSTKLNKVLHVKQIVFSVSAFCHGCMSAELPLSMCGFRFGHHIHEDALLSKGTSNEEMANPYDFRIDNDVIEGLDLISI